MNGNGFHNVLVILMKKLLFKNLYINFLNSRINKKYTILNIVFKYLYKNFSVILVFKNQVNVCFIIRMRYSGMKKYLTFYVDFNINTRYLHFLYNYFYSEINLIKIYVLEIFFKIF